MRSPTAAKFALQAQEMFDRADAEGRPLTTEERAQAKSLLDRAEQRKAFDDVLRKLDGDNSTNIPSGGLPQVESYTTPGEAFIASEGYKSIAAGGRGQSWTTGLVEVSTKGTLLEGAGAPGTGTGGGLVPSPQVAPGVVAKLFQPLRFENLLLAGVATTNTVRYAVEGTATSAAAGVAEAGLKPESTLGFSVVDEPIKKIATTLTIADELIDDAPALSTFVNGRLSLFVNIEAERQLLRGTSGGNEVQGILTSRSVPVYAGGTAVGNKAKQIFKAMNGVRGSAFVEPEWVLIHPTDYEDIRLLQDGTGGTIGQFFGGGPFQGPYGVGGAGGAIDASGQVTGGVDTLWGKPVYVTASIGAGTALIGTRDGAQVWNRGGMRVEATNSHSTNFAYNLTMIRAERRLGLTVLRPGAFCEVRLA